MTAPGFSVLLGLASRPQDRRIGELLQALAAERGQPDAPGYEVIAAIRDGDLVDDVIRAAYPELRVVSAAHDASLPELRRTALDHARGEFVAVTGDYSIPAPGWLTAMRLAFQSAPTETVAVGGAVDAAIGGTGLDQAIFLCEYAAFLPPIADGPVAAAGLAGMNIAYRRAALDAIPRECFTQSFWEHSIHPALVAAGGILVATNSVRVSCGRALPLGHYLLQRWHYSRHFAGSRFAGQRRWLRAPAAVAASVLPVLLFVRQARCIAVQRGLVGQFVLALPWLVLFNLVATGGEVVGYITGAGDSLCRIE